MIADKALLAVLMLLYDDPCSCKLTRKSNTLVIDGLYKSIFHLDQTSYHSLIYEAYCFWLPFDVTVKLNVMMFYGIQNNWVISQ